MPQAVQDAEIIRTDVAHKDSETGKVSPLAATKTYETFPVDEYTSAGIIAFHVADLPPSKFADNNDPVPSCRFLLSNGKARKWTKWYRISYHAKAALPKLFTGFSGIANILTHNDLLFNQSCKILLEANTDNEYAEIIKIKPGTDPVNELFYDQEFVPYKQVKAYGHLVNLRLAVLKCKDGIKELSPDEMIDPPTGETSNG